MNLVNVTTRHHFAKAGILYMLILSNWKTSVVDQQLFSLGLPMSRAISILKWEKDTGRTALTDFSLEGIMHAKQCERISKLTVDQTTYPVDPILAYINISNMPVSS